MYKIFPIFFFLTLAFKINGQSVEPINTDRPDQSDGTYTLSKNAFQIETGVTYGEEESSYFLHNTMLRYGLTPKTEFRVLLDYGRVGSETGIMPVGVSVKRKILSQEGCVPDITAVGYIMLPFLATDNFRPDKVPATLLLAFENELSDKFSVGYNFGLSFDGETSQKNWLFTTALGLSATERLSFFAEYFAEFSNSSHPDHNIDVGAAWLLKNNLQIDIAMGTTIFQRNKNQFITTGISYRFN